MSASLRGASSSDGHAGLRFGLGRPVSGNVAASEPVLILSPGTDIARTVNIQSNQETHCEDSRRCLRSMLTIYCVGVPKSSFDTFLDLYECDRQDARQTSQQKSPVTKERLEVIFARLDRLGLGENDGHTIDPQDSVRRVDLFKLVIPTPRYSISLTPFQRPQSD